MARCGWCAPITGCSRASLLVLGSRDQAWLAEALASWPEKFPDVRVRSAVIRAHPTVGLIGESSNQDLLVVGSHGRRPSTARLLGSVSQGVLHHAYCPVAVIPTHID
jgi:hypothetical protein